MKEEVQHLMQLAEKREKMAEDQYLAEKGRLQEKREKTLKEASALSLSARLICTHATTREVKSEQSCGTHGRDTEIVTSIICTDCGEVLVRGR